MKAKISCKQANQIDLVDYLEKLGYKPAKVRNNDYWYLSPLRDEKKPSFKVNRKLNLWYDHGTGNGGNLVDIGKLYHKCSVKELLAKLGNEKGISVSFHPPAGEKKESPKQESKIRIITAGEIISKSLQNYLQKRAIDAELAKRFCREVSFEIYGKRYVAIGFQNNANGNEFRSATFKGSSSPKNVSYLVETGAKNVAVFEGFFSFLSWQMLVQKEQINLLSLPDRQTSFLILNSLSFFEKSRSLMEKHETVNLFLDRDPAGIKCTQKALKWSDKYKDQSHSYAQCKDLNEYLIKQQKPELKKSSGLRIKL